MDKRLTNAKGQTQQYIQSTVTNNQMEGVMGWGRAGDAAKANHIPSKHKVGSEHAEWRCVANENRLCHRVKIRQFWGKKRKIETAGFYMMCYRIMKVTGRWPPLPEKFAMVTFVFLIVCSSRAKNCVSTQTPGKPLFFLRRQLRPDRAPT